MKKVLILSLSFSIFTATTLAYDEHREDGFQNATTTIGKKSSQAKLNEAISKRQWYYFKNKIRNNSYKNRLNQQERHVYGKQSINVNEQSTQLKRDGELNSVPFYEERREATKGQYSIPNNSKRNFRSRAINYYVEGGDANQDAMSSNLIYGSTHKVRRVPIRAFKDEVGAINKKARNETRSIGREDQIPTGYQKGSFRRGDSLRNFMHPYMKFDS